MESIATFLGIEMDKVLLKPTTNGLLTKSNSMFRDRLVKGKIATYTQSKWKEELTEKEKRVIITKLSTTSKKLGYYWNISKS